MSESRKYEVEIKEKKGTCDTTLFEKMAKNGDITATKVSELIEEYLEENFEFINFKVNFIKVRTYEIICELLIQDNNKYKTIRTRFIYIWNGSIVKESNLQRIKILVNKAIIKMFIRPEEEE